MPTAEVNGTVIARSERHERLEGNVYFPPDGVDRGALRSSETRTRCPWKGEAHYYHVVVGDKTLRDAAWFYPNPKQAASRIKDHIAFWKGVEVHD
jgi:uncharacterized protein (DUF427 family)